MEKKPVKRSPYIVKLSRDHHASLLFCWKLRQGDKFGIEKNRMKKYVSYFFAEHMQPHFKEEEQILFAPAKNDEMVQQALQDHKKIHALARTIISKEAADLTGELLEIAELVDNHVRFEERKLFPHLEQLIPEDQLKEISEKLGHAPEKDVYKDEFWIKKKN